MRTDPDFTGGVLVTALALLTMVCGVLLIGWTWAHEFNPDWILWNYSAGVLFVAAGVYGIHAVRAHNAGARTRTRKRQ